MSDRVWDRSQLQNLNRNALRSRYLDVKQALGPNAPADPASGAPAALIDWILANQGGAPRAPPDNLRPAGVSRARSPRKGESGGRLLFIIPARGGSKVRPLRALH